MATFEKALKLTLPHEGGYSNNPKDLGAETYCGISRKNHPNWVGWKVVDEKKPLKWNAKIKSEALDNAVAAFYRVSFWNKMWGENMPSQEVANFIFDWFVNSGYHSISNTQKIVDATPTGVMDHNTLRKIKDYPARELLTKLIAARTEFVKNIVRNRPNQAVFLQGWLNRINSFKTA